MIHDGDALHNNNRYFWWQYLSSILTRWLIDYKLYYVRFHLHLFLFFILFLEIRCNWYSPSPRDFSNVILKKDALTINSKKIERLWWYFCSPMKRSLSSSHIYKNSLLDLTFEKYGCRDKSEKPFIEMMVSVYLTRMQLICKICSFEKLTRDSSAFARVRTMSKLRNPRCLEFQLYDRPREFGARTHEYQMWPSNVRKLANPLLNIHTVLK